MSPAVLWLDFLDAVQFLTRVPVPAHLYREDGLARAVKFFPLVGLMIGGSAGSVYLLLDPHLPKLLTAALVLVFLVCLTGCFHEDALADAADGFGGGRNREQILTILHDSRIGSYGGTALVLSLVLRLLLLSSLARVQVIPVMVAAHVLCRWTTLPLSYLLPPARETSLDTSAGQGARVAKLTAQATLISGTLFSFACTVMLLRWHALAPMLAAALVTALSGIYFKRRIGGVTGDCFGATNQIAEVAVYLCGVWAV